MLKITWLVITLDSGQEKYVYTFVSIYSNNKYPYIALHEMWYMKNQHWYIENARWVTLGYIYLLILELTSGIQVPLNPSRMS